jgi:LruC domain-containing protein
LNIQNFNPSTEQHPMFSIHKPSWLLPSCAAALILVAASAKSVNAAAGMILFEDSFPNPGDLDFNDQVVAYNYAEITNSSGGVTDLRATFNLLAVGATIHNGLYLHLPLPSTGASSATVDLGQGTGPVSIKPVTGESDLVIPLVDDTRSLFPGSPGGLINTDPSLPSATGSTISLDLQFAAPVTLQSSLAPFDLFIARTGDYGHQIHLSQFAGTDRADKSNNPPSSPYYVNSAGLPFALNVPDLIAWPQEHVPIDLAYPDIDKFAASGGTQNTDWYSTNVNPQFLFSSSVPEPSSLMLLTIVGTTLATRRRAR